jgi:uncharacterized protein (TIGR02391 family)
MHFSSGWGGSGPVSGSTLIYIIPWPGISGVSSSSASSNSPPSPRYARWREVEIRVRALGGFGDELLGVALMANAFTPKGPGPLADPQAEPGEQEAMMALFRGAIGTFKNPSSDRAVNYDDPILAAEVVLLADLLMRLLDRVEARQTAKP